jgi:hypothetical protein
MFWVEDPQARIVPFTFNEVQTDYYDGRTSRDDILKARQQGFSTLILAEFTVDFLTIPNIWCVCVSHESEATKRLFRKVHLFLQRLPFVTPLDTSNTNMIVNKATNSVFYIGTAGSRSFGQGDTIHRLHLSEFSRYPDPERLIRNIVPAVPNDGVIIKETTANGMGNFHHGEWVKEKEGKSPFRPYFSPWFATKRYAVEPPHQLGWTAEEQNIAKLYRLSPAQLYWRRNMIATLGSIDSFKEQYPATDLEAFLSSGVSAFDKEALGWFYNTTVRPPSFVGVLE